MDQSTSNTQRYVTLPDGHFRILSLLPSNNREAKIECELLPRLIDGESYEALSYVWGRDDPSHLILVAGEEVLVRPNLYAALMELRLTEDPRSLWVDSLCINQQDVQERNTQVKQMGKIYSSATSVIAWLGIGDGDTEAAFTFLQGMAQLDPATMSLIKNDNRLEWEDRKRVFRALGMAHGLDNYEVVSKGLVKLMNNVWWTRIWTVQEIALARSAYLRCGSKSVSWDHLNTLAAFAFEVAHRNTLDIGRPMDEAVFDELTGEVSKLYGAVSALDDLAHRMTSDTETHLQEIGWTQFSSREATEPRDMIFALLGLCVEKASIEIDYTHSKKQVYTSAMKAMLLKQRTPGHWPLYFLQDNYQDRDPTLPSWVPDFGILRSFKTTTLATSGVGMSLTLGSLHNASGRDIYHSELKFLEGDTVLEMEGVHVDEIEEIGQICPRFPSDWKNRAAQLEAVINKWKELLPTDVVEYVGGGSLIEAFWRTVTFDLDLTDRDYLAGNPNRRDKRLAKGNRKFVPTTLAEEAEVRAGIVDAPIPKTILEKLGERRLFITKLGYLGLGPASMQKGDIVCVLRGVLFPVLARPMLGRYGYIGESFVHGIMDGEMIAKVQEGAFSFQPFCFI